jgi:hypothetical protein
LFSESQVTTECEIVPSQAGLCKKGLKEFELVQVIRVRSCCLVVVFPASNEADSVQELTRSPEVERGLIHTGLEPGANKLRKLHKRFNGFMFRVAKKPLKRFGVLTN